MLANPAKIEEYKETLNHRMRMAKEEQDRLNKEIRAMMEKVAIHE